MKMHKSTFRIGGEGGRSDLVEGLVSPDNIWGVDKRERGYRVTHIPTGQAVGPLLRLREARGLAADLAGLEVNWMRSKREILEDRDLCRAAKDVVMKYVEKKYEH